MAVPIDDGGLLERAICYALGSVAAVSPRFLSRPTPCSDWTLRMLLHHVNDSLTTLHEAIETGHIDPDPIPADTADLTADLTATFRDRACQLLDAWTAGGDQDQVISIAKGRLMARVVASTGAIEIAVHGWDIAQACGHPRPIPHALANDILKVVSLAADVTRDAQFAAPVTVSPLASPSDRLVAFLGRRPIG